MIRNRSTRTLATLCLTTSFVIAAMAGPALVSAAPAPLQIGYGPGFDTSLTSGRVQAQAAPGFNAAFDIWARNTGPSNISKLFLTGITSGTFEEVTLVNTGTNGSCGAGPGTNDVELHCSWTSGVPRGATIQIRVVFTTPSSGQSMPVDFEWSTTGFVSGKNNSHGDAFKQLDSVPLNGNINVYNGGYLATGDSVIVATSAALNRNNPQSTKITAPETGIPVSAAEDSNISQCTALFGNDCFGQAIVLNVNNGKVYADGFRVDVVYNRKEQDAQFIHFFDDTGFEELATCAATPVAPCAKVTTQGNTTFATLFLTENGKTFGH
jgi:hypothetical protein